MAYPVDLTTNPGAPISPITGRPHHGPYVNSTGARYIFSNAFPLTGASVRIVGAYKSTDNGATWLEQDALNHVVVYDYSGAGNPAPNNTACPHPSNPALVTVFFFSAFTVLSARDFNIETGSWTGAAYGGVWPFVASGAEFPNFSDVAARPIANEFVIFGMTSNGAGQGRMQFVRLAPSGGFSAPVDAFPVAAPTDVISELASCPIACSADETIYALAEQLNFGSGLDNLVQCKLSPANVGAGSFVDFDGSTFPTNPLGAYDGNGRLIAAADKVFLCLGFIPTVGIAQCYAGWVVQGGDFTFPYAFGVVNATVESATPSASVNYGKVYYWFRDSTLAVFVVSVESPGDVAPVLSPVFPAATFFPGVNLALQEVRDIGAGLIGAIGYSPSGVGLVANYWESAKLPPLGPVASVLNTIIQLIGWKLYPNVPCEDALPGLELPPVKRAV